MRAGFLLNVKAGRLSQSDPDAIAETLETAFERSGHDVTIVQTDGESLDEVLKDLAGRSDTIFVAGGDGTVAAAAKHLQGSDKTLGILPFGTMNLVARDVGMTTWSEGLAERLARGATRAIDVGEVNGQSFMHSVVFGAFARIAQSREAVRDDPGLLSWSDLASSISSEILQSEPVDYTVTRDGVRRSFSTQSLLISNNKIVDAGGLGLQRSRLDGGELYLYAPGDGTPARTALTLMRLVLGRLDRQHWPRPFKARSMTVSASKPRVTVSIDGEVRDLELPLHFRIHPRALKIWIPEA